MPSVAEGRRSKNEDQKAGSSLESKPLFDLRPSAFDLLVLLLQFVLLQHLLIVLGLIHAKVREQLSAVSDFAEKTAAGRVILPMIFQMIREERDSFGEDRDLNLR